MIRVVQMDPGPTPTLMADAPASQRSVAPCCGHHVSRHDWSPVTQSFAQAADHRHHARGVAGGGIDENRVRTRGLHGQRAVHAIIAHADGGAHAELAVGVLGGGGEHLPS